jgi:hypothetical protein
MHSFLDGLAVRRAGESRSISAEKPDGKPGSGGMTLPHKPFPALPVRNEREIV